MNTIPVHQAIRFVDTTDEIFNNEEVCPCTTNETWEYLTKPGDITEVQVLVDCTPITYGANTTVNGSFEEGTGESPDDWTINDTEKIIRSNADPYQGAWSLRWNNPTGLGTATQDTGINFLAGETWLINFYAKVENPAVAYLTPLLITLGGLDYLVTPTEDYTLFTIPIVFIGNGTDQDLILTHNSALPAADFMYLDVITLQKLTYGDNTCLLNLVYNPSFQYGQNKVIGDDPVTANFDGWTIVNVEESLTGGVNGNRCAVLTGFISPAVLEQTLPVMIMGNQYLISFWAKATTDGDQIGLTAGATDIESFTLTTEWQQYSINFTAPDNDTALTFTSGVDSIYLDDVFISLVTPQNDDSYYVEDVTNDKFYPAPPAFDPFDGGYNFGYDWETLFGTDTPGCYQIIAEMAQQNLLTNSKFELGVGNLFTGWTLTPGNGTIVQSAAGGLNSSRALQFNRVTNLQSIAQLGILEINTTYTIAFWAKVVSGSPSVQFSSISTTFGNVPLTSSDFKRFEFTFTTGATDTALSIDSLGNNSSFIIDNVYLSFENEGVRYSEYFKYDKTNGVCAPEIVWYDLYDSYGINYESGFKNRIRIKDLNFNGLSYPTEMEKTLQGLQSSINLAKIKKVQNVNITLSPEFIHDRLAVAVRHSNIEIGGEAFASNEETNYQPQDAEGTGCRLMTATVILAIEGEYLAQKTINCIE